MKIEEVAVSKLVFPEKNVRIHTKEQIKEIGRSLEMFGQIRPVVVDENNVILAGNGLVMAMRELGWKTAKVLRMTGLSDNQKKKLMLADNRIFDLGLDDADVITELLAELKDDLDIPGFDDELLTTLLAENGSVEVEEQIKDYGIVDPEVAERKRHTESVYDVPEDFHREPEPEPEREEPRELDNVDREETVRDETPVRDSEPEDDVRDEAEPGYLHDAVAETPDAPREEPPQTAARRSIRCPNCGEVIWLD